MGPFFQMCKVRLLLQILHFFIVKYHPKRYNCIIKFEKHFAWVHDFKSCIVVADGINAIKVIQLWRIILQYLSIITVFVLNVNHVIVWIDWYVYELLKVLCFNLPLRHLAVILVFKYPIIEVQCLEKQLQMYLTALIW